MDITEELEAAIPHGPALPDPAERVTAGRARLRRRRVVIGVGTAAAVAAIVVPTAVLAAVGDQRTVQRSPAAPPASDSATPAPPPSMRPSRSPDAAPWKSRQPAVVGTAADGSSVLRIRDGAMVHERRDDVFPFRETESVALDLSYRGHRYWILLEWNERESSGTYNRPEDGVYSSFDDFVTTFAQDGGLMVGSSVADDWPDTLRLTDQGTVVANEGSEILQRTDDPQLGPNFAAPDSPTGAALVRAREDGVSYFVVWRVLDGKLDVITVPPQDVVGATFEELLSYARSKYADEVGLR